MIDIPVPTHAVLDHEFGITHVMLPASVAPLTRCGILVEPGTVIPLPADGGDCWNCGMATMAASGAANAPEIGGASELRGIGAAWLLAAWVRATTVEQPG